MTGFFKCKNYAIAHHEIQYPDCNGVKDEKVFFLQLKHCAKPLLKTSYRFFEKGIKLLILLGQPKKKQNTTNARYTNKQQSRKFSWQRSGLNWKCSNESKKFF